MKQQFASAPNGAVAANSRYHPDFSRFHATKLSIIHRLSKKNINFADMKTTLMVLLCALVIVMPVRAQEHAEPADSVGLTDVTRFRPQQLIAPAALVTVGALAVGIKPFVQARKWINKEIGLHRCGPADDYIQYLPLASYMFLDYCGVHARRPIIDRTLTAVTGFVIMSALTQGTKWAVDEPRPTGTHRGSFPSGHTATAFLGAELIRLDYGTWPGVAAYAVASGVAVMRILNQRHWINDLLAGAGIGILSARAALWLLPVERRIFRLDRRQSALVIPTYAPATRTLAMTATLSF